ncbi:MAG TPA: hypothetical protein VMM76_04305 [Pirellulaceae bacterium]|nr:hypothetical protein [Pirellulaceae bacterium]
MVAYLRVFHHVGFFFVSAALDPHLSQEEPTTLTTSSHAAEKKLVLKSLSSSELTGLTALQVISAIAARP